MSTPRFDPEDASTWQEDEKATGSESRLWIHCRNADEGEWHFMRTLDGYCFTCAYWAERDKQQPRDTIYLLCMMCLQHIAPDQYEQHVKDKHRH